MSNFTNSPLVDFTRILPATHRNSPRNQPIRKITIHHVAGVTPVERLYDTLLNRGISANYGIGSDGRIALYTDERDRAWTSSSRENDHQAITIEVSNSATGGQWPISKHVFERLLDLCEDICRRNNIPRLVYDKTPNGTLTRHNFFSNTNCPGPYLQARFPFIAEEVNRRLGAPAVQQSPLAQQPQASASQPAPPPKENTTPPAAEQPQAVLFRVQAGAFRERKNAEALLARLHEQGFTDAFITTTGGSS